MDNQATMKKTFRLQRLLPVLVSFIALVVIVGCSAYLLKDNDKFKELIGQEVENNQESGEPKVEATLRSRYDIVYIGEDRQLYQKNLETLEVTQLTDIEEAVMHFQISPDKTKIAYSVSPLDYKQKIISPDVDLSTLIIHPTVFYIYELDINTGVTDLVTHIDNITLNPTTESDQAMINAGNRNLPFDMLVDLGSKTPNILSYKFDSKELIYRNQGVFVYNNETKTIRELNIDANKGNCGLYTIDWGEIYQIAYHGCSEAGLQYFYKTEGESFSPINTVENYGVHLGDINNVEVIMDDGTALMRDELYMGEPPVTPKKLKWLDLATENVIKEVELADVNEFVSNFVVDEQRNVFVINRTENEEYFLIKYNWELNTIELVKKLNIVKDNVLDLTIDKDMKFVSYRTVKLDSEINTTEFVVYDLTTDENIAIDKQTITSDPYYGFFLLSFIVKD